MNWRSRDNHGYGSLLKKQPSTSVKRRVAGPGGTCKASRWWPLKCSAANREGDAEYGGVRGGNVARTLLAAPTQQPRSSIATGINGLASGPCGIVTSKASPPSSYRKNLYNLAMPS